MKRIQYIAVVVGLLAISTQSRAQLYVQGSATFHTDAQASLVIEGDVQNLGLFNNTGTTNMSGNLANDNGAKFIVASDATLNVSGNIENEATMESDGAVDLKGNFDNQGTCTSTGSFNLSGGDQAFYHKNASISYLSVNGGGYKTLTSDVSIEKNLELSEGFLAPSAGTKLLMKEGSEISTGSTSSFVSGMLYWEGVATHYYPVGKSELFAPVEFQDLEGEGLTLGMEVVNPADVDMVDSKINVNMVKTRYFKSDVASGTFKQGYLALPYFESDNLDASMKVGVAQSAEAVGPYEMLKWDSGKTSNIADAKIDYTVSGKPATEKYFTVANYVNADMTMFFVPNAMSHFAPDTNDRAIRVYGDVFEKENFLFTVSNQWGNLIFKSTSLGEMAMYGWDGTNRRTGRREMIGQYYFTLKAVTLDGETYKTAGSVWIID